MGRRRVSRYKARIRQHASDVEAGRQLRMAVLPKQSDDFLGSFVLLDLDQDNPEMGGWLKESAHGRGYGREAAAALQRWASENVDYDHIIWPCAAMNTPSRRLAEVLGGKVKKEYEKTTARGTVWAFVEYWIPNHRCLSGRCRTR